MSLSRRTFTKEFKEGAVRRLELGTSVTEVVPACGKVLDATGGFIDHIYNERALHSALGYRLPSEFEQMPARPVANGHGHGPLT